MASYDPASISKRLALMKRRLRVELHEMERIRDSFAEPMRFQQFHAADQLVWSISFTIDDIEMDQAGILETDKPDNNET